MSHLLLHLACLGVGVRRLVFIAVLFLGLASVAPAQSATEALRFQLILDDAVAPVDASGDGLVEKRSAHLLIYATLRNGQWSSVMGIAPTYNKAQHIGYIENWSWTEDRLKLNVRMDIRDDAWVSGGLASYQIEFKGLSQGALDADPILEKPVLGTFQGDFEGISLGGQRKAELTTLVRSPQGDGVQPATNVLLGHLSGEKLQQRVAQSAVVSAAHAYLKEQQNILAYGILYRIEGDAKYVELGAAAFRDLIKNHRPDADRSGIKWAWRAREIAYALELFGDAWDESLRQEGARYLDWVTSRLLYRQFTISRGLGLSTNGVRNGVLRSAAGISALAHMDEAFVSTQHAQSAVRPPTLVPPLGDVPRSIRSLAKQPVPINKMPSKWVAAGPFPDPLNTGEDFLAHLGGSDIFHEEVSENSQIQQATRVAEFMPLKERFIWGYQGLKTVEFTSFFARNYKSKHQGYHHTGYFYTAFSTDVAHRLQLQTRAGGPSLKLWLNGQPLTDGDYVLLEPGTYFLLVRAHISSTNDWGKMWMSPAFKAVSKDDMNWVMGRRMARAEIQRQVTARDAVMLGMQGANGSLKWQRYGRDAELFVSTFVGSAFGSGGWFQMTPDAHWDSSLILEYVTAYYKRYGVHLTKLPDAELYIPRLIYQTTFQGKSPRQLSVDGEPRLNAGLIARSWPIIPASYKPAALWAWNHYLGLNSAADASTALSFASVSEALFTILHYPIGLQQQNPAVTSGLQFVDEGHGGYILRNGFEVATGSEIVAQFIAASQPRHQRPSGPVIAGAGAFVLHGLGHTWSAPARRSTAQGLLFTRSQIAVEGRHAGLGAQTMAFQPHAQGGGYIALNMAPVFYKNLASSGQSNARFVSTVDVFNRPIPRHIQSIKQPATRSLLVDFANAPAATIWLSDRFGKGPNHLRKWYWALPQTLEKDQIELQANGFTIRQGDAVMRLHFFARADLHLEIKGVGSPDAAVHASYRNRKRQGDFIALITLTQADDVDVPITTERKKGELIVQVAEQRYRLVDHRIELIGKK